MAAAAGLTFPAPAPAQSPAALSPAYGIPLREDDFWQSADPGALGMGVEALRRHQALCETTGADACLVVFRGRLVQEWHAPGFAGRADAMSATKSITGLLVGLLIDDGRIAGPDTPVCAYLPDWCGGRRGRVALRHLLTMTAGLPAPPGDSSVVAARDKNTFVRGLTPSVEPGTRWAYSNEGAQLLSPVLDAAAGEPIQEYARRRLFQPLGMRHSRMRTDAAGHAWTYADAETTPRDLARVGLLMLQRGCWRGRRVLSRAWVEASTRPSQRHQPQYGLLWWTWAGDGRREARYAALGCLDTNVIVVPDRALVVVRMQRFPRGGREDPGYQRVAWRLYEAMAPRTAPSVADC